MTILRDHGSREELSLVKDWQAEFAKTEGMKGASTKDGSGSLFVDLKDLLA